MEKADEVVWFGDAELRFLERAAARDQWGKDNGHAELGKNFVSEVSKMIETIAENVNQFQARDRDEQVAPLEKSEFVIVYKKEYFIDPDNRKRVRLVLLDVRKFY